MVLCDHNGDKIHAYVDEELSARYEPRLKEGYWIILENFSFILSGGAYRTSIHPYELEFSPNTRVRVWYFLPCPLTGFQPVAFRDIVDGHVPTDYLVDVIGQIAGASYLDIVSLNGKDTEKITLELLNQFDDRLTLNLWGKVAVVVSEAVHNRFRQPLLICVVRFGKISVSNDRTVCTAYSITDVRLNPDMVEVESFSRLLPNYKLDIALLPSRTVRLVPEIQEKYGYFRTIPKKSLIQVLETQQIERSIVLCTIAAIDYDMGWYYVTCKNCNQQVLSVPMERRVYRYHDMPKVMPKYYCEKCKSYRPELLPRYNLQLVVLDNTANTKFLLLDSVAEKLLGLPCVALTGSVTDQTKEPIFPPVELNTLVGETYFFKIDIEKENLLYKGEAFKVLDIIPSSDMINDEDDNQQHLSRSRNASTCFGHQYPESEQLSWSEMPTKFVYDVKEKAWKKRICIDQSERPSMIKKIKTEESG